MLEIGTSGSVGGEGGNILSYPATVQIAMCVTVPGLQRTMSIARADARERAFAAKTRPQKRVHARP